MPKDKMPCKMGKECKMRKCMAFAMDKANKARKKKK